MKNTRIEFSEFIANLQSIYSFRYKKIDDKDPYVPNRVKILSKDLIINKLWGEYTFEVSELVKQKSKDVYYKIGNNNYPFKSDFILNYIRKSIYTNQLLFIDISAEDISTVMYPLISKLRKPSDYLCTLLSEIYERTMYLYNQFKELYDFAAPYPWIDDNTLSLSKSSENVDFVLFHYLLYLTTYIALRYNNIEVSSPTVLPIVNDFEKYLSSNNSNVIFYGQPQSGKTTFLTYYAKQNRSSVFYIHAGNISPTEVFKTLRPDYLFWTETWPKYREEFSDLEDKIINPYDSKKFNSDYMMEYLHTSLSTDLTLIIDDVKDLSLIEKYNKLSCRVIFVMETSKYRTLPEKYKNFGYEYNNHEMLFSLIKNYCDNNINADTFNNLLHLLGTNVYLYKLIGLNYKKCQQEKDANGKRFLDSILNFTGNTYDDSQILSNFSKKTISLEYKHLPGTAYTLNKFILHMYEKSLTSDEQQLLRLLCRIQKKSTADVPLDSFLPYIGKQNTFIVEKLQNLGWIDEEKFRIPVLISAALNSYSYFDNHQYTFNIKLLTEFFVLLNGNTTDNTKINKNICFTLIETLHKDYCNFITIKAQKVVHNLNTALNKAGKQRHLKIKTISDTSTLYRFREKGYDNLVSKHSSEEDPFSEYQFMDTTAIRTFYQAALFFAYKFDNKELWKTLYGFVVDQKDNREFEASSDWNTYLKIWNEIKETGEISYELKCNIREKISTLTNPAELRPCIHLILDFHIHQMALIESQIIRYLTTSQNNNTLSFYCWKLKILIDTAYEFLYNFYTYNSLDNSEYFFSYELILEMYNAIYDLHVTANIMKFNTALNNAKNKIYNRLQKNHYLIMLFAFFNYIYPAPTYVLLHYSTDIKNTLSQLNDLPPIINNVKEILLNHLKFL